MSAKTSTALVAVLVVLIVVAGVAGYFAGSSAVPVRTVTSTVTQTVTAGAAVTTVTVTQKVTETVTKTEIKTQTVTVTATPTPGKVYKWKFVDYSPPSDPRWPSIRDFAKFIERASGGRLVLEVYSGGELFPIPQTLDMIAQGVVQLATIYPAYWASDHPVMWLLSSHPGPLWSIEDVEYYWEQVKDAVIKYLEEKRGVKVLGYTHINAPEPVYFVKPVNTLNDLKGLMLRSLGGSADWYAALGAKPVAMPGPELYQALQLGTIDGAEYGGWADNYFLGLHEVVKYALEPAPGCALHSDAHVDSLLIANPKAWEELPDDLKAIVLMAKDLFFREQIMNDYWPNAQLYKQKFVEAGVQIKRLSPEDCQKGMEVGVKVIANAIKKNPDELTMEYVKGMIKAWRDLGYKDWADTLEQALKSEGILK